MSVQIKLEGFAELEAELDKLSRAVGKGVLRRALRKAAQPTADMAQGLAPRDTGALAQSIVVGAKLARRQAGLHRKMFQDDRSAVELFVGPSYQRGKGGRHGHLLEFGTVKMAPQPFMRPAWDATQREMLDRLKADLWAEVTKAVARAERKAARLAAQG